MHESPQGCDVGPHILQHFTGVDGSTPEQPHTNNTTTNSARVLIPETLPPSATPRY